MMCSVHPSGVAPECPEITTASACAVCARTTSKASTSTCPSGSLIVITGVSGSGKSSLAFDTVYAEGQRRYVETFSPYARQFLDRMDRPRADRIEGIPPAIAIDQTNPVRTSRSTVGTMTELNDHLKLLFARAARLFCHGCGREVRRDTPESVWERSRAARTAEQSPRADLLQSTGSEPLHPRGDPQAAGPAGLRAHPARGRGRHRGDPGPSAPHRSQPRTRPRGPGGGAFARTGASSRLSPRRGSHAR